VGMRYPFGIPVLTQWRKCHFWNLVPFCCESVIFGKFWCPGCACLAMNCAMGAEVSSFVNLPLVYYWENDLGMAYIAKDAAVADDTPCCPAGTSTSWPSGTKNVSPVVLKHVHPIDALRHLSCIDGTAHSWLHLAAPCRPKRWEM